MTRKLFHDNLNQSIGTGGMELATPGSAVGLATDCATGPGLSSLISLHCQHEEATSSKLCIELTITTDLKGLMPRLDPSF